MAKFRLKAPGKPVEANGYTFVSGEVTEVPDEDVATIRKLRGGKPSGKHPCFEEVLN